MCSAFVCERTFAVVSSEECENARDVRAYIVVLIIVALLVCGLPVSLVNKSAWGDEVEGELIFGTREDDKVAGDQDALAGSDDAVDDEGPVDESSDSSELVGLSDEENRLMEGLASLEAKLDEELGELEASKANFDVVHAGFTRGAFARGAVLNAGNGASDRIEELDRRRRNVLAFIKTVQGELMQSDDYSAIALITGTATFADVEIRRELLERLVIAEGRKMRQTLGDQRRLRIELMLDEASACHARRELREAVRPANEAAYKVERCCAQVRQCIMDVRQDAEGVTEAHHDLLETRDAVLSRTDTAKAAVADAEQAVSAWYDEVDAQADLQNAISFGTGVEFSLAEDEFVETWSAAIDEFFAQRAQLMGTIPLQGYGRAMAVSAYRYKIDPRLCAAVSIAESNGGQACIRPHNAWGWGAADSDPYGLAVEWASFAEAIEAWHEGMAASTSGLATARTVSALGAVYCSSPVWGATVIEQMELISGFVY